MAWRFKASKYKNAAPIVPKPEACVRDISVGSYQTYGNNIAASAAFMAFNVDHNGSSLGVLPIDDCGRKSKTMPLLHAHTDTVTDMDFSNFHDGLLATGSQDCMVKIWTIPEKGLEESLCNPEVTFCHRQKRVECVLWHPSAEYLLTTTSFTTLTLWDVFSEKEAYSGTWDKGCMQSISWRDDGTQVALTTKDKVVFIVDPRADCISQSADSHQSIKDSRVVWLGNSNRILTTGFDSARQREVYIRDLRNFSTPEKTLVLDSSTGILIPLYDPDTAMLFLAGKGDTTILYMEVTEKDPYLVEGIRHTGEQTKGACLVPKRALNVMQAEVNRVLQLTSSSIIPIMYQVPRKSYRDFHSDLFPETNGCESRLSPTQWIQGMDLAVSKISLDPSQNQVVKQNHRGSLNEVRQAALEKASVSSKATHSSIDHVKPFKPLNTGSSISVARNVFETNEVNKRKDTEGKENGAPIPKPAPRRVSSTDAPPPGAFEGQNIGIPPVAKPRNPPSWQTPVPQFSSVSATNAVYKPRLGPKPFTTPKLDSSDKSPVTPDATDLDRSPNELDLDKPNNYHDKSTPVTPASGEAPSMIAMNGSNKQHSPNQPSPDQEQDIGEDGLGDFDRSGIRASIAERRKMYEARSISVQEPAQISPVALRRRDSLKNLKAKDEESSGKSNNQTKSSPPTPAAPKRTSTVFGRVSKYRHLKGTPSHKSLFIENVRNVSRQISGECDGFHANPERLAYPLGGAGGKIAIVELNKAGRLPDGVQPALVNGSTIMDFKWDPFNNSRIAVGCDDGTVRLWVIPTGGLTEPTNSPACVLQAHTEKIYCLAWHPLACDILATTSYDMTTKVWDLQTGRAAFLIRQDDQVVALAWSSCGKFLSSVTRGSIIRIYEVRKSESPIREGKGPGGSRGARIVWTLHGAYIAVTGFDKVSERQIMAFQSDDLSTPLTTVGLDVSPAILIPFYDEDSSTLFLTGRGDSTIYAYEMSEEPPYLNALSHHRCPSTHQGLAFLPKISCDVSAVEFAKAYRLNNTTIEPLSFTVPRIKSDLFQDDLFPDTKVLWEPTMSAEEWLTGTNTQPKRISLKPPNMDNLSESHGSAGGIVSSSNQNQNQISQQQHQQPAPITTPKSNRNQWSDQSVKQTQAQIQKSVSNKLEINMKLEQDKMEGVDEIEWTE